MAMIHARTAKKMSRFCILTFILSSLELSRKILRYTRPRMKFSIGLFLVLSSSLLAQQAVPEIKFDSVPTPLKLPADIHFGEVSGVAVNSKGHVFVFSRGNSTGPAYGATAAQLLEFGPDGKYLREIGKNLYAWSYAHAVRVDKDDNVWAIDKGSDMIGRFNPEGREHMVFGPRKE